MNNNSNSSKSVKITSKLTKKRGGKKKQKKKKKKNDLNYISLGTERIPFKVECNQIWDIEAVNFLIYFSVRQNSKKESRFHVNVHTISLCIVFSKSSLNQNLLFCHEDLCAEPKMNFNILNLGGFDCFWLSFIVRQSKKIVLLSRGQKLKSIFFYIDMYTYIMLRIFLA